MDPSVSYAYVIQLLRLQSYELWKSGSSCVQDIEIERMKNNHLFIQSLMVVRLSLQYYIAMRDCIVSLNRLKLLLKLSIE